MFLRSFGTFVVCIDINKPVLKTVQGFSATDGDGVWKDGAIEAFSK